MKRDSLMPGRKRDLGELLGSLQARSGESQTLTERVSDRIRLAIVEGELGFGENISEDRVANSLGVSRTPVRDALAILQYTGLVEVIPKRGSFVFTPSVDDLSVLCDYRMMLEREALLSSVQVAREDLVSDLETYVDASEDALRHGDNLGFARLDNAFHQAFFQHCGNRFIRRAHELYWAQLAAIRTNVLAEQSEKQHVYHDEHKQITACVKAGDVDEALAIHNPHIERTRHLAVIALTGVLDRAVES